MKKCIKKNKNKNFTKKSIKIDWEKGLIWLNENGFSLIKYYEKKSMEENSTNNIYKFEKIYFLQVWETFCFKDNIIHIMLFPQ